MGSIDAKASQRGLVGVGARPETDLGFNKLVSLPAALFLHGLVVSTRYEYGA
jgi:hypothetical protein